MNMAIGRAPTPFYLEPSCSTLSFNFQPFTHMYAQKPASFVTFSTQVDLRRPFSLLVHSVPACLYVHCMHISHSKYPDFLLTRVIFRKRDREQPQPAMAGAVLVSFFGGDEGEWRVIGVTEVKGETLPLTRSLSVVETSPKNRPSADQAQYVLRGVLSNLRYTTRDELKSLVEKGASEPGWLVKVVLR